MANLRGSRSATAEETAPFRLPIPPRCQAYSQKTADVQAYALLRKPQIAKLIADAEAERLAANKITAARTLEEDRRIAFNDPRRFATADGNLQPITEWSEDMAAARSHCRCVVFPGG